MGNLLLSPSGRIGRFDFMKGMIILALLSAVISLSGLLNFRVSQILEMASILLLIPFFFMAVKRSHDANKSGWMSLVWFLVLIGVALLVGILMNMLMPSPSTVEMESAIEFAIREGAGFSDILKLTQELTGKYGADIVHEKALPGAIGAILTMVGAAWVINLLNPHDPLDNQYGPA